jgi:hypothetical protein
VFTRARHWCNNRLFARGTRNSIESNQCALWWNFYTLNITGYQLSSSISLYCQVRSYLIRYKMEFPEKRPSVSKEYCSVPQCSSRASRDRRLSFHRFPKKGRKVTVLNEFGKKEQFELRDLWAKKLRLNKPVTPYMIVCSRHFSRADFFLPGKKISCFIVRVY